MLSTSNPSARCLCVFPCARGCASPLGSASTGTGAHASATAPPPYAVGSYNLDAANAILNPRPPPQCTPLSGFHCFTPSLRYSSAIMVMYFGHRVLRGVAKSRILSNAAFLTPRLIRSTPCPKYMPIMTNIAFPPCEAQKAQKGERGIAFQAM